MINQSLCCTLVADAGLPVVTQDAGKQQTRPQAELRRLTMATRRCLSSNSKSAELASTSSCITQSSAKCRATSIAASKSSEHRADDIHPGSQPSTLATRRNNVRNSSTLCARKALSARRRNAAGELGSSSSSRRRTWRARQCATRPWFRATAQTHPSSAGTFRKAASTVSA